MTGTGTDICGIGAVTGYGWGTGALWEGLLSGRSACTPSPGFRPRDDDPGWVAHVPPGGRADDGPTRFARSMRATVREAIADAVARGWSPGHRVGLVHAVVLGEVDLWRSFYLERAGRLSIRDYLGLMPSTPVSLCMQEHGFRGPAMGVSAMCASGNAGLITAKSWLDHGLVDDVIMVATDISCTPETLDHFVRLGVAVTDQEPFLASRPFQTGSRGFVMGEASVAFVISRRAIGSYMRFLGGAMTHDAHHVTSIDPKLPAVLTCFRDAFRAADVDPRNVRYLNAHGPGTRQCDSAEAHVVESVIGPQAGVYSMKPLTGHCQGAASAVEIAAAALSQHHGVLPAPPQVSEGHPQLITGRHELEPGLTAKSSLGMGGHNSVVVLAPPLAA
jgi:3-oxoacyl-[acyl-carrier-protein] synthase II